MARRYVYARRPRPAVRFASTRPTRASIELYWNKRRCRSVIESSPLLSSTKTVRSLPAKSRRLVAGYSAGAVAVPGRDDEEQLTPALLARRWLDGTCRRFGIGGQRTAGGHFSCKKCGEAPNAFWVASSRVPHQLSERVASSLVRGVAL